MRLPVTIDDGSLVTTFEYNTEGQLIRKQQRGANTLPRSWSYAYDGNGQLNLSNTPEDGEHRYSYDLLGNLSAIIDEAGGTTVLSDYDADGRPGKVLASDGVMTTLTYGPRGWLTSMVQTGRSRQSSSGEETLYGYDGVGQLIALSLPGGEKYAFVYDAAHRLAQISDGAGNSIVYQLDALGNRITEKIMGADGSTVQTLIRQVDVLNRLQQMNTGDGQTWRYEYDANGKLSAVTDPLARVTRYRYDALNRMITQALPAAATAMNPGAPGAADVSSNSTPASGAGTVSFTYGSQDQLASVTDPRGLVTRYGLNHFGERIQTNSPDSGISQHGYDRHGQLQRNADARDQETFLTRDTLRRIVRIDYSSGVPTALSYVDGSDRLARITDESGSTAYGYDDFGRLTSKVQTHNDGMRFHVGYARQAGGKLAAISYPSGHRVSYVRNSDGKVSSITLQRPGIIEAGTQQTGSQILSNILYQPFGPPSSWQWGNGLPYLRSHDASGRLSSYPLGPLSIRTLSYDAASQITGYRHTSTTAGGPADQRFDYDGQGRLITAQLGTSQQHFRYDANGNRTAVTYDNATFANTIAPDSNRLLASAGPIAQTNTFDATGNLISDGTITYQYSARGRLASTMLDGATSHYLYNGIGERVQKTYFAKGLNDCSEHGNYALGNWFALIHEQFMNTIAGLLTSPSSTSPQNQATQATPPPCTPRTAARSRNAGRATYYVYDDQQHLLGEYDPTGQAIQETVYLDDTPIAVLKPGADGAEVFYIYADHLNTPRIITNQANVPVWRWDHGDAFGVGEPNHNPSGESIFNYNLRFPGQIADQETNLVSNGARFFDQFGGRYLQSDPIGLTGGINTYSYVRGNPISKTDSSGLCPFCILPTLPYIPELVLVGTTWWAAQNAADKGKGEPSLPIDLPGKIPDLNFDDAGKCPVGNDGVEWRWQGKSPQGGHKGGYKNPNGPESIHPDLDHGGNIGPHWDFNDRKGSGYRIDPNGTIWPK
ncbi:MAG: RHS repeat-associated core domain-containing protein [Janthinobacterium lividum]